MTYDDLVAIALEFPDVAEGMSYGTPSLKRKGRFMLRLKEDGESVAVKLDWDTRNELLATLPSVYYLTPHYENYPALLARLDALDEAEARRLVRASWKDAPRKA